ncbi:unnamed protein product, partial [Clonostachys chloroleuca]
MFQSQFDESVEPRFEDPVPNPEDDVPDVAMHAEPTGLVQSVFNMFSSVAHAFTGFRQTVTRYISNPAQEVVETRQERTDGNVVNKRRKLDQPKEYEGEVQWASDKQLQSLEGDCKRFQRVVSHFFRMDLDPKPGVRTYFNDKLRPIGTLLAGSISNPTPIMCGKILPRSHSALYTLFLEQLFEILPRVYDNRKISELKASHGPTLHPRLDLGFSSLDLDILFHIKSVFSFQSISYVLAGLTHNYEDSNPTTLDKLTMFFIDRLLLDINAIFEGLIPPSYLDSPDYLKEMITRFPTPARAPLVQEMPGTFPNELARSTPRPTSAPSEVPNPPEPVQKVERPATAPSEAKQLPPQPVVDNTGARTQVAISRAYDTSKRARLQAWTRHRWSVWNRGKRDEAERDASRAIKSQYVTNFTPWLPMRDHQELSSILRTRLKHPSRDTPKRLKALSLPKHARFSVSTLSPPPRTHTRSGIARLKEPGRTLHISKKGMRFQNVRPASSMNRDSPSPTSSPIYWRSYYQPLAVPPPSTAFKKEPFEPFAGIEQKTYRSLDALFRDSGPIALQLSDLASSRLAQKREEEARIAAEAAEAAERAAAEKARIELEARLALTGGLRVPRQKFVPKLSGDWNRRVHDTLTSAPTTSLTTTVEGIDLRRHDFAKVVPETEWLNDEIVNGSLMWLDQAINSAAGIKDVKKQTRKCLTMSSFFFKQLRERGVGRTQRTLRRYGVEKRNFLDIDTILLPICERSHWTLLVVRPSKRTVSHMDSMKPVGSPLNTNLALAWVKDVLEDAFVAEEWTVVKHEAPRQTNGWDCGVHTITNAMCVALGLNPIDSYSTEDMPLQRLRIASVLLNRGFSGDFDLGVF